MKKSVQWLKTVFRNMKLKNKLTISYAAIIVTAVIWVSLFLFLFISENSKKQILYSADQSFMQAEEFLGYRLHSLLYASDVLRVNQDVQHILNKNEQDIRGDIVEQNKDMIALENYMYSLYNSSEIFQISLYVPGYLMYADQDVLFRNLDTFMETPEYEMLECAGDFGIWLPPEEIYSADTSKWTQVISLLRKVRNVSDLSETIAIERISIRSSLITSIIDKSDITTSGIVLIRNERGQLIACSNDSLYQEIEEELNEKIQEGMILNWDTKTVGKNRYLIRSTVLEDTDWTMTAVIPYQELYRSRDEMIVFMLITMIAVSLFTGIISGYISKPITRRISELAKTMESVTNEIPEIPVKDMGEDEIGSLFRSFSYMSERMKELIALQYENGKQVKNAELRALRAQINPHFLYNTLDLINWEALDSGSDKIVKISQALARFYKLSLNQGQDISSIKEELDHIIYYTQIQNFRFEDRICMNILVPEELKNYKILHIVLQPLVENSIKYGIGVKKEEEQLHITIRGREEGEELILEVEDDGKGMTDKQMEEILCTEANTGGYGVKNIQLRFKLQYGERYGLHYSENESGGVTVAIRFPKRVR